MTTTADSTAGACEPADDEFPSHEFLPHYDMQMDWQAYDRLPPHEKVKFVDIMTLLEQERWIGRRARACGAAWPVSTCSLGARADI